MNKRQLYESIMRDVSRTVKQCLREYDTVNESSFLNNLLKYGKPASSIVAAIQMNIKKYIKEYPDHVSSDINVYKLVWDPKTHYITWTGKEKVVVGGYTFLPNKPIFNKELKEWSSDSDAEKFIDEFNKTSLGKELMKASPEWKKQEEKRKKELQDKYDNDPEYQAEKLVKLIKEYFHEGGFKYMNEENMFEKIKNIFFKWEHNNIFRLVYEKNQAGLGESWQWKNIRKSLNKWGDEIREK